VKDHQLHVSYSVQESEKLHTCFALHISKENSTLIILLVEQDCNPKPTPNTIINHPVTNTTINNWTLREHILSLGTYTITQIHAVAYTHTLNPEHLLSITEPSESSTDSANQALIGHIRISKDQGHDRELPSIVFEACEPEWSTRESVNVSLRWGLVQGALKTGGCHWDKYHLYVAKDEEEREFLGVAVVQAFAVEEMVVSEGCKVLRFYVQAICACGLSGEVVPACDVDVEKSKFGREEDSSSQQPLIDDHV
jgi:hypothetical protein